jgi:hypothetical protein
MSAICRLLSIDIDEELVNPADKRIFATSTAFYQYPQQKSFYIPGC